MGDPKAPENKNSGAFLFSITCYAENMNYELDHIGIAVTDLDAAIAQHQALYGFKLASRETLTSHGVEIAFLDLPLPNNKIELLANLPGSTTLTSFIEKRGPGLHHICYRVSDIKLELQRLSAAGCQLIDKQARRGAGGHLVAFVHPKSTGGVLTELCES